MSQLKRTIELFESLENPKWEENRIYGLIKVDELLEKFVKDYGDDFEIELEDAQGSIISNDDLDQFDNLHIKFLPPRKEFSFFAINFDDYLNNFSFLYKQADEFYISDIKGLYFNGESSNNHIKTYCEIIELYNLLLQLADHTEKDEINAHKHIILSVSGKVEIPVIYCFEDIERVSKHRKINQIQGIKEELFSAPYKSAKILLLKKAISQYLSGNRDDSKFSILLERLAEVFKSYKNNYELFLNEFSFEDEKEKIEKNKQQYLLKLNEILSGINGKLLAVPISLVIVAGQMKPATEDNFFVINLIILFGAIVFALLMWMLTANQLHSLLAVKSDYTFKKDRLKLKLRNSLYSELRESFYHLDSRFKHQRLIIRAIDLLVLLGLLFSFCIFEFYTSYLANNYL